MDRLIQLQLLADEVAACRKCELHQTRTQTVFSRGNSEAKLCIISEAPGQEEDFSGLPFVGRSGKLLDKALQSLGIDIEKDIYVCNIVKCRPPDNRKPNSNEIQSCFEYLERQLDLTNAKVLLTLGATSTHNITNQTKGIMQLRGKWFQFKNLSVKASIHPSYILRQGGENSGAYEMFKEDIKDAFERSQTLETLSSNQTAKLSWSY